MAVLSGIGLARVIAFQPSWLLPMVPVVACIVGRRTMPVLIAVALTGLVLGGARGTSEMHRLAAYQPILGRKVTVVGVAASDGVYDTSGKSTQLEFDLSRAAVQSGAPVSLPGTIGAGGFGENMVFRGDIVSVTGKLRAGTGSHQAWLTYAQLHVVRHNQSTVDKLRRQFNAGLLSALPEPLAPFAMGLLIGQHSDLPDEVYQDLLMVGLVHIIAVSGYNLTIILRACSRLLGKRSKYQTFVISLSLIGVFLLFTGYSASIVRAAIVSGLALLAWYYGRNFKPLVLIGLAAAVTALVNPLYVWGDMGWYLSFLAFYGVLVLAPQLSSQLLPERFRNSLLVSVALESLCAEIMTLPVVLYVFGQMSFVSLAANVLIAVLVPLAMLVSLVAGLAGTFLLPVAGWFAWPATVLLTYMLDMAHLLSRIPHVFVQNVGLSLIGMLAMYASVLLINLTLHSRLKRNRAIITVVQNEHMPPGSPLALAAETR